MRDRSVVLDQGEGRSVLLRGTEVVFKVESDRAHGASCVEFTAVSGFDTGLHVHRRLEETFCVLDGEFDFTSAAWTPRAFASCVQVRRLPLPSRPAKGLVANGPGDRRSRWRAPGWQQGLQPLEYVE
jgi:hypothetical protein